MIYIYPEKLEEELTIPLNYYCYILFGNDPILMDDTKSFIFKYIESFNSYECFQFLLNNQFSWERMIATYQTKNFFYHKKKFFYLLYLMINIIVIY